jgi:hypothetical protein
VRRVRLPLLSNAYNSNGDENIPFWTVSAAEFIPADFAAQFSD